MREMTISIRLRDELSKFAGRNSEVADGRAEEPSLVPGGGGMRQCVPGELPGGLTGKLGVGRARQLGTQHSPVPIPLTSVIANAEREGCNSG